jgi:hypothetical protein
MTTSYLSAFNNLILKFNDDLIVVFPEENDFKVYRRGIEFLISSNAKKACNLFKINTFNYRQKIIDRDVSFFLKDASYSDVVNTKDEGIILIINKLKNYWTDLSIENQKKIWDYMNTLITLGDLVK